MPHIEVSAADGSRYRVTITEGSSSSTHDVTVDIDDLRRLGQGRSGNELVEASFRFLLDREPKESIMSRFDLSVIGRYFPEFENRIGDYL